MPLSNAATPGVYATSSDIIALVLLTFKLEGFADMRVVNNTVDIESRGLTYEAFPFKIKLLQEDTERLPEVTLQIDNVDGRIMEYIRSLPKAPTLTLEVVTSADNFQAPERSVDFLKLTQVGYNALAITGTLVLDNFMAARFPAHDYTPAEFPALFGVVLGEKRVVFAPTDPYYNFVNSILFFEGSDGASTFEDTAGHGVWTRMDGGTQGDATIAHGDAKDGTGALRLVNDTVRIGGIYRTNAASTGGIQLHQKITHGTGLTVEGWFKPTGFNAGGRVPLFALASVDMFGGKYINWYFVKETPTTARLVHDQGRDTQEFSNGSVKITLNVWTHIAWVTNGNGRHAFFINGRLMGSEAGFFNWQNESFTVVDKGAIHLGTSWGDPNNYDRGSQFKGLIDCVRVTNAGRYWDDFTPQTNYQTAQGSFEIYDVMRDVNSPSDWWCLTTSAPEKQVDLHMSGDDLVVPSVSSGDLVLFREGSYIKDGFVSIKMSNWEAVSLAFRVGNNHRALMLNFAYDAKTRIFFRHGEIGAQGGSATTLAEYEHHTSLSAEPHTITVVMNGSEVTVRMDGIVIFDKIDVSAHLLAAGKVSMHLYNHLEHRIQEYHIGTDVTQAPL